MTATDLRRTTPESANNDVRAERCRRVTWTAAAGVVAVAVGLCLALWAFLVPVLRFYCMCSDIVLYWTQSLAWRTPFDSDHVPGYPLIIALVRLLTANRLPALPLMWGLAAAANALGAVAVYAVVVRYADERIAFGSVVLYLLWPLVGTTYVVYPVADGTALALLTAAAGLLLSRRFHWAALLLGVAAVIHKGTWVFAVLFVFAAMVTERRRMPWGALLILALPLTALWIAGMRVAHYSPLWLVNVSIPIQFGSRSQFPVMDGLLGTVLYRGARGLVKGVVLWAHVALIVALWVAVVRGRVQATRWYAVAILSGMSFLYVGLNQDIVWAAVRFSRLLAVPIGWEAGIRWRDRPRGARDVPIAAAIILLLLAMQFAYCWYMARGSV